MRPRCGRRSVADNCAPGAGCSYMYTSLVVISSGRRQNVEVGVRDLKTHLSAYLERVKAGETLVVTHRGRPVARLEPVRPLSLPPHLEALWRAGKIHWSGRPTTISPGVQMTPGPSIAEQIMAERERD